MLYPLCFQPILKERIWGGRKLISTYNKNSESQQLGESWEISGVSGDVSVVSNGLLKGTPLNKLIEVFKDEILGKHVAKCFGDSFPILIKYIDAKKNLSIQLHPNDELARKRHNSFGKTEMWYIMEAEQNAGLVLGFKEGITGKDYLKKLKAGDLMKVLNREKVQKGDAFFIETGTVHAIGGGIVLAEIQQTSDVTYRIYDYNRIGKDGRPRELHTELAKDAIDFQAGKDCKIAYEREDNKRNEMVNTRYFITNYIQVNKQVKLEVEERDSFSIYMCVEGSAELKTERGNIYMVPGQTVLIPACIEKVSFISEKARLLEVYL